ncbi:phage tail protein I [Chitinimonas sp. PSY-7]|uniref:phage tail protein I n=1 Tax=Chitinimonas sp. PSY-7 TaxID=3459088 RepID=UPI0040401E80
MNLLPPNSTPLERAIAEADRFDLDPTPIGWLADAQRCPTGHLPWLAWSLAVDGWEEAGNESAKRALIRSSIAIHKHKGTAGSVRRALEALGLRVEFKEWRELPGAVPYTFQLTAWVNDNQQENVIASPQLYERIRCVVDATRNARSQYTLRLGALFSNQLVLASAIQVVPQVTHRARASSHAAIGLPLCASASLQALPQITLTLKACL